MTREEFIYKYDGCIIESENPIDLPMSEFLKVTKAVKTDIARFVSIVEKERWKCKDLGGIKLPKRFYFSVLSIPASTDNVKSKSLTDFLTDYNNNLAKREEKEIEEKGTDIVEIKEAETKAVKKKKYKIKCTMEIEVEEIID